MQFKNVGEIYQALLDGKKITHGYGYYVHLVEGVLLRSDGTAGLFNFSDPNQWRIYTPPKPKVKLYQYAWKNSKKDWCVSTGLYIDDKEFGLQNPVATTFKRLDHTMIEVDDE